MSIDDKIKKFWEAQGSLSHDGNLVTHKDIDQVKIEMDFVLSEVNEEDILLDIGCGNGFSTSIYAKKCKEVIGIDYAESMINAARSFHQGDNLQFQKKNILEIDESLGTFSVVLSTRCLINLMSWEQQREAIKRMHRCLKKNGKLILIEGSKQGRKALNELRVSSGLEAMQPVWHNFDVDEQQLVPFLQTLFDIEKKFRFGLYDVLTRVYYPASIKPAEPQYATSFHKAARELLKKLGKDPVPEYCREFVLVLRKGGK